ncbi:MAG: transposase [Actinomycetes bacterium]|jgi:hypothetical protein
MKLPEEDTHQNGDSLLSKKKYDFLEKDSNLAVDTFGGRVHVEWDPQSAVTPLGQLPFFIEFLKLGNLLDPWIDDCPLDLVSPNAPSKRDVLGTLLLSILAGHRRYAHVTTIRCDNVNPTLLGMNKIVSEDSLRRSLLKIVEEEGIAWLQKHLYLCYQAILDIPWVLDVDTTVKVLYGKQEGAVVGYNPTKPGRPSHTYHTFSIANLRLILDVEVQPGNQMAASYTAPNLWSLLDRIPRHQWPEFIRGDCAFGSDGVMRVAEEKGVPYVFKLKQTKNVKRLIEQLSFNDEWEPAGQGWHGQESYLQLTGWSEARRVIVLRKPVSKNLAAVIEDPNTKQLSLNFGDHHKLDKMRIYEYAVLVTSLPDEVVSIAQHYRDRADSENVFDELKNQWGWGGFTTQDLKRCRLVSRAVGLIYNWWNLFARLATPDKHLEGITSRPLLLHAVGKQSTHAGQTFIKITSTHGKTQKVKLLLSRIVNFFQSLKADAEQLSSEQLWYRILSKALEKYLKGRVLQSPIAIPSPG